MTVKIVAGVYGYLERGFVRPKSKGDVIKLDDKEAKRLIGLGVAVEVPENGAETALPGAGGGKPVDHTPNGEKPQDGAGDDEDEGMAMEDMNFDQLKAVAEQQGIDTKNLRSRKALMEAIEADSIGGEAADPEG